MSAISNAKHWGAGWSRAGSAGGNWSRPGERPLPRSGGSWDSAKVLHSTRALTTSDNCCRIPPGPRLTPHTLRFETLSATSSQPHRAITLDDLVALNQEIVALARAGVPLERGLLLSRRDLRGRLGRITESLGRRLERGVS